MAYEISSSVAAQLTDYTAQLTTISASYDRNNGSAIFHPADGGRFSPDGTKLALNVISRNGGDGSSIDYGIDIWHTGSSGWTLQESIDTGTKEPQQIEWYNDHEIWALLYQVSQPNRYVSSSSGWSTASDHTSYAIDASDGLSRATRFQFSRDKRVVALYASNNTSNDDKVRFIVSGSTPWTTRGEFDANVPNINNLHWGGMDENGMYRVFIASTSEKKLYNVQVNPTTGEPNFYGDFHSHFESNLSANMLYWHEDSNTLLVGTSTLTDGTATNHTMAIYAYQSSSAAFIDGSARETITSSVDCAISPHLPSRWISGSTDAFIFGSNTKFSSQFSQGSLQALESGSDGWKWTVIDGFGGYGASKSMIDISVKGDIFYDAPRWKKGVDMNHHDDDQWRQTFPNTAADRVDDGVFNIRRISALDNSDTTGPSVSSVAITSATNAQNSTLNEGDVVSVTVTMDEATVVNTTGGTPFITLNVGGVSRNASYASGTGTTSLIFQYTIASSETTDSDGISIGANAISLNSGTMQDASGNNATITHSAVSANSSFKVDTTKPTISSLSVAANNSTVTVTFAEDVYASSNGTGDLVAADFTLGLSGGNQANISLNATPSGISKTAQNIWVLTLNGTDLDSIALGTETLSVDAADNTSIFDLAGNAHTAAASTVSLNNTAAINDSVTETIGSGGGTVKAGNTNVSPDVTVTIPSNALSTNVSIGASVATAFDPKLSGVTQAGGKAGEPLSAVVRLTPHGQTFESAVTVQFKLEGSAAGSCPTNLQIWKRNSATGVWYQLPSDLWSCSSGTISISTTSFSDFAALGGNNMARTKINNVQLARLAESNKVLPEAINITGSAESLVTSVNNSDVFIIQQAGNLAKHVSGSALKTFFAGGGIDVTGSNSNDAQRITFVHPTDDKGVSVAVDGTGSFTYTPSTNTMTVENVTGSTGNFSSTLTATTVTGSTAQFSDTLTVNGAATVNGTLIATTVSGAAGQFSDSLVVNGAVDLGGNAASDTITATGRFDSNLVPSTDAARDLGTTALGWNDLHLGSGGVINLDGGDVTLTHAAGKLTFGGDGAVEIDFNNHEMTNVDIDSGAIDNTVIGGTTKAAGSFTNLVATGDVDLGDTTSDTITATGRFDSDLVPSTTNARALGTDALRWNVVAENITASAIQVQQLDVVTINSITQSETTLEIDDKLIVSAVSASSANADGGGLRIGGGEDVQGHASVLWNHASSALDLSIGDEAQLTLVDGALKPSRDDNVDLGASGAEYKDLYIDGIAYLDNARVQTIASGSVVIAGADGDLIGDSGLTFAVDDGTFELQVTGNVRADLYFGDGSNLSNVGATIKAASTDDAEADGNGHPILFASASTGTSKDLFIHEDQMVYYPASKLLYVSGNLESAAHVTASQLVSTGDVFVGAGSNLETSDGGQDHSIFPTMTGPGQTLTLGGGSPVSIGDGSAGLTAGAITGTSLNLQEGNITNAGDINANSLSIDAAASGLKIDAEGADNATFEIIMNDDDADALSVKDSGGQDYLVFTSTNSAPLITFSANPTFAGRTIADLGTVTTADIDGGNIDGVTLGATNTLNATAVDIDGATDIGAALAATDLILVDDGANGTNRKSAVSRIGDFLGGGDGIQVTNGVLSISPVEDLCSSASKNSILSDDLVTASLSQDMVSGSLQVFLNGMLQTPSGSVQGGSDHTAIFDYYLITASFDGEAFEGKPKVWFTQAIDSDDVIQLRYLKK